MLLFALGLRVPAIRRGLVARLAGALVFLRLGLRGRLRRKLLACLLLGRPPVRGLLLLAHLSRGLPLIAFAAENGMRMRGHTLDWYAAMPDWALAIRGERDAERELTRHIETVVGRYRGRVPSWDVVNEPIAENPGAAAPMRGWMPRCSRMSISATTTSASASAAATTAVGGPRKVKTER